MNSHHSGSNFLNSSLFELMSSSHGLDVRFGSKADIPNNLSDVRFTPESGRQGGARRCPLCAINVRFASVLAPVLCLALLGLMALYALSRAPRRPQ
jgi:hypothetical protein